MTWLAVLTANWRLNPAPMPPSANRIRLACASVVEVFGSFFPFSAFLWVRARAAFSARNAATFSPNSYSARAPPEDNVTRP